MSGTDLKNVVKVHYADLGKRVQGADIRYATFNGQPVAIVSVLGLAPDYASPEAAAAELARLGELAAETHGWSGDGTVGGHKAMIFTTSGGMSHSYWVSGKTIVTVLIRSNEPSGEKFLNLYAAKTP